MKQFLAVLVVALFWANNQTLAADDGPFEKVRPSLVTIRTPDGVGSGFIAVMDNERWLITNEHVLGGQTNVIVKSLDGTVINVSDRVDVSIAQDLVRFRVSDNLQGLVFRESRARMSEKIWVYGDSDGEGVVTSLPGVVLGVGGTKIEISAEFVTGNSGSPVVDQEGNVIGVATYVQKSKEEWFREDTRFSKVRRFAVTINHDGWERVSFIDYIKDVDVINKLERDFALYSKLFECSPERVDERGIIKSANAKTLWGYGSCSPVYAPPSKKGPWIVQFAGHFGQQFDKPKNKLLLQAFSKILTADKKYMSELERLVPSLMWWGRANGYIGGESSASMQWRYDATVKAAQGAYESRLSALLSLSKMVRSLKIVSERGKENVKRITAEFEELKQRIELCNENVKRQNKQYLEDLNRR